MLHKIAIIHHHLHPGGVTRIIQSQIQALMQMGKSLSLQLVVGEIPDNFSIHPSVKVHVIPALNYLQKTPEKTSVQHQINALVEQLKECISPGTILHIHNLNLGKNPLVTLAAHQMLQQGYQVLNHAHDFAEDRPGNMAFLTEIISRNSQLSINQVLYPNSKNYRMVVINSFDQQRTVELLGTPQSVFLLHNPVTFESKNDINNKSTFRNSIRKTLRIAPHELLVTYPVRVIRRKNIGEYIFLAKLFAGKARFVVTQPPKNPAEITEYEQWKVFCQQQHINIIFEAGLKTDFEELIMASDFCFTTSKQEGFGMVYLEPWLLETPVIGRDIPYITNDLINKGITFPFLYQHLKINNTDFKNIGHKKQQDYILKLSENSFKQQVFEQNSNLIHIFDKVEPSVIQHNMNIIKQGFSLQKYAEELYEIYEGFAG